MTDESGIVVAGQFVRSTTSPPCPVIRQSRSPGDERAPHDDVYADMLDALTVLTRCTMVVTDGAQGDAKLSRASWEI